MFISSGTCFAVYQRSRAFTPTSSAETTSSGHLGVYYAGVSNSLDPLGVVV